MSLDPSLWSQTSESTTQEFEFQEEINTSKNDQPCQEKKVSINESLIHITDHPQYIEGDEVEVQFNNVSEIVDEVKGKYNIGNNVADNYDDGEESRIHKRLKTTLDENFKTTFEVDERKLKRDQQFKQEDADDEKGQITDQEKDVTEVMPANTEEILSKGESEKERTNGEEMLKKKVSKEELPTAETEPTDFTGTSDIELEEEISLQEELIKQESLPEEDKIDWEKENIITKHEKFYETVKIKLTELMKARKKNRMLHKSLIDYYKKKKMEYVYDEETSALGVTRRYIKKIKILEEMTNLAGIERVKRKEEINELKTKLQECNEEYKNQLTAILHWETELGKSIMESHTSTGKDENVIELIVQRHEVILNQLNSVRLSLIKLEKLLSFKENILKNLVCLEGNLSLLEYEQLSIENNIFSEKIEERDEELSSIRKKTMSVIHTHAHVLEKANSITENIDKTQMDINEIEMEVNAVREQVNKMKEYRDGLRLETTKLKKTSGLIIQPTLVIHYEDSLNEFKENSNKLESIMDDYNKNRTKILKLRDLVQTITELHETTGFNKNILS